MASYDLAEAVELFSHQTNVVNTLWGVFAAATFTAAGFGTTLSPTNFGARVAISVGFWAFALGHLRLLRQGIEVQQLLSKAILHLTQTKIADQTLTSELSAALQGLTGTTNRSVSGSAIHIFIDVCVTVAVWSQYQN